MSKVNLKKILVGDLEHVSLVLESAGFLLQYLNYLSNWYLDI